MLYRFTGGSSDGANPAGDLTLDQSGNIYGTTIGGGGNCDIGAPCGTIYELTPSGGGWTITILYFPQNDNNGFEPEGGVIFDTSGNLYGVFFGGGPYGFGTVYELLPSGSSWAVKDALWF